MDTMSEVFITSLQTALCWPKMELFALETNIGSSTVSLKTLCQYTLLEAGIYSFFGRTISQLDPKVIPTMLAFSKNAWMLFYGLPSMFSSAVATPKRALIETFAKFASLPESQRSDQSWSVQQILIAQEIVGIDLNSRACMLIMILWA